MISDAQGGTRGVRGLKGAVQGPPMDPSDGPIASLVEHDTLILTPIWTPPPPPKAAVFVWHGHHS
jgi:hypothetical protein